MVSIFTHIPIRGRFSSTSIRLPTHIETIRPQNRAGSSVTTLGPGVMPWMIRAPIISAITGLEGMPRVSIGMNEVCAPALLAASGAATPSIAPLPNCAAVRREPLLQRVGGEAGQHRPAARQDAQDRAQAGAAQHRADRSA